MCKLFLEKIIIRMEFISFRGSYIPTYYTSLFTSFWYFWKTWKRKKIVKNITHLCTLIGVQIVCVWSVQPEKKFRVSQVRCRRLLLRLTLRAYHWHSHGAYLRYSHNHQKVKKRVLLLLLLLVFIMILCDSGVRFLEIFLYLQSKISTCISNAMLSQKGTSMMPGTKNMSFQFFIHVAWWCDVWMTMEIWENIP